MTNCQGAVHGLFGRGGLAGLVARLMLVKICGITCVDDTCAVLEAGADLIGLNLVSGPRRIELETAMRIVAGLDDRRRAVVLTPLRAGRIPGELPAILRNQGVVRLQLYGEVTPASVGECMAEGFECIWVQGVADGDSLETLDRSMAACGAARPSFVLLDAASDSGLGGTGRRANWDAIEHARLTGRDKSWPLIILAGGLNSENVAQVIARLNPAGVDVSSGVESTVGRKDRAKIAAFVDAVRRSSGSGLTG